MTTPLTTARNRTIVAAVLAGGLLTSLSACGGNSTTASTVSEAQPIQGSPLVACGMAQLTPRVADNDPMLGRANTFYTQLDQAQTVPPAVQNVYSSDISGLDQDQQHEVLLMLSSLNECPGLSAGLQQSVLDAFDQLTPQTVAPSTSADAAASNDRSTDSPAVVVRSDNTTVDDSSYTDNVWWDGEWNGHPWWFRPTWDHPVTDTADWVQWGADRRAGIVWRWQDNGWQRIGRPTDDPPNRPWLPTVIGPGRLDHHPATVPLNQQPLPGAPTPLPVPGQPQVPQVAPQATASVQPGVTSPQQITRPGFRDTQPDGTQPDGTRPDGTRPDGTAGQPGSTVGGTSSSAPTPTPGSDRRPTRTGTGSTTDTTRGDTSSTSPGIRSDSSTTENGTTRSRTDTGGAAASTPTPAPKPDRTDNSRGSDSVGLQGGATNSTDNHHDTGDRS